MNKMTILAPTDFSELSNVAMEYAFSMANRFGAKIVFFHSLDWGKPTSGMAAFYEEVYVVTKERANALLNDLVQRAKRMGIEAEAVVTDGSPFVEIIQTSRKIGAELIIMGTHGRTGLSHVLIGSQAERVVRQASCPVLTVKSPTHVFAPV